MIYDNWKLGLHSSLLNNLDPDIKFAIEESEHDISFFGHMYNSRGREFIKRHLLQTNGYAPIPPFQFMPPKTHKTCDSVQFSSEDMHHSERRIEKESTSGRNEKNIFASTDTL